MSILSHLHHGSSVDASSAETGKDAHRHAAAAPLVPGRPLERAVSRALAAAFLLCASFRICDTAAGQTIVPLGASWEYLHPLDGVDPAVADPDFATTWHTPDAYDGPAFQGPAPATLGYGTIDYGPITTNIGTPPSGQRYTAYFRKTIVTTESYEQLRLRFLADDGGVLYIDGVEVARINFSAADEYFSYADGVGSESQVQEILLGQGLEAGQHVIAFSLHNQHAVSSDLGFIVGLSAHNPLLNFSFTIYEKSVTIWNAVDNVAGTLIIPAVIGGVPVTHIGSSAFQDGIWTRVILPASVKSIGVSAFEDCSNLASVSIPSEVTFIGDYAFRNCANLTSVTLPQGVTSIKYGTFYGCSSLASLTIPESVTSIEDSAFYGCSSLASVTLPQGVTSLGNSAFYGCASLASVTLPEGVTSIGHSAFNGCASLASVTVPEGVTYIGHSAFYECASLTSVTLPEGVTFIQNQTFYGCSSLTDVTLPQGLGFIGSRAFEGCSSLASVTLPEDLSSIGSYAFSNCTSLANFAIPESLRYLGRGAFEGTGIPIQYEGILGYVMGPVASFLVDARSVTGDIVIPSEINGLPLLISNAYSGNESITSAVLPDGLTSVPSSAFAGCTRLASITIPESVTSIGSYAFSNCTRLASITIPAVVTSIEGSTFYRCSSLASITMQEGVTSIGNSAFYGCTSLAGMVIPESVTSVGSSAFYGCSSLTSVVLPLGVTSIKNATFYGCSSLASIIIPQSVISIGYSAFDGCSSLADVTISEGVTSLELFAFNRCTNLADVTIPGSVTFIADGAFSNCSNLAAITFEGVAPSSVTSNAFSRNAPNARAIVKLEHATSFGGLGSMWNGLLVVSAAQAGFDAEAKAGGLTAASALPSIIPTGDGLTNLVKYAFNLNLARPGHRTMAPGGFSGLPLFTTVSTGAETGWRVEFVRRKVEGLTYMVMGSNDLLDFDAMPGTSTVTDIDDDWERVVFEADPSPGESGQVYARVEVMMQ